MSYLGYIKHETLNFLRRQNFKALKHPEIHDALKVRGIFVIPDFFSAQVCAELRAEIDRLLKKYENKIWKDALGSDQRIFGADLVSQGFNDYFRNAFIREVLSEFENASHIDGFTMAARLDFKEGNRGSGNGWHRDAAFYSQTKSILYLSDTSMNNGPFEYIIGSQTPTAFIRGWMRKVYQRDQFRYTEAEIQNYLSCFPDKKIETFPAKAGALLLVDTRGLHRGSPIQEGCRYAATNYYFMHEPPAPHLLENLVTRT